MMTKESTEDKLKVVRLEVSPQLHQAFKMRCVSSGVSMKNQIIQLMAEFAIGASGDESPID